MSSKALPHLTFHYLTGLISFPSDPCLFCPKLNRSKMVCPCALFLFLRLPAVLLSYMATCYCLASSRSDQIFPYGWGRPQPPWINIIHVSPSPVNHAPSLTCCASGMPGPYRREDREKAVIRESWGKVVLIFLSATLLIGILAAMVWKAVLCFSLLCFSLSQDGFTQISLAWRQKTYCWQEELTAVSWRGPAKATLATSHFPLGESEEQEHILRSPARWEMLILHLDNLLPSFRVWRPVCSPVSEALPVPWSPDQGWFRPACGVSGHGLLRVSRLGSQQKGPERWAFPLSGGTT